MRYNIKILVSIWLFCFSIIASAQTFFTKYEGNPVLRLGPAGSWDSKQVSHPRIIFDGKVYRMWYAGSNDTCRQIGYAASIDGFNWTKYTGNPVIKIGERGALDDFVVSPGAVLFDGTQYHMYYTARGLSYAGSVCHATSPDGITWIKDDMNNPVLTRGTTGWWDDFGLSAGPVLKQRTEWKMWYNGFRSDTRWYTGLAVSSNGVHWTKDTLSNPLLEFGAPGTWDEYEEWIADVLHDSSYYEAFYFGNSKQRAIGYAVSRDGIAWGKYGGNPILTPEHSTDDKAFLFQSCVLKNKEEYKIWYSDGATAQICFALSAALTPASAQEKADRIFAANKPVAGATKNENKQAKIPVPKNDFNVELKDGRLYISSLRIDDGRIVSFNIDITNTTFANLKDSDVKKIFTTLGGEGRGVYLISEQAIAFFNPTGTSERGRLIPVSATDGSRIFTQEGTIYTSSDGSLVASTPTTLLVITPKEVLNVTYEILFGKIPPFKKPTISGGRGPDEVFIRDETLVDGGKAVRLELDLKTLNINVAEDLLALGSR